MQHYSHRPPCSVAPVVCRLQHRPVLGCIASDTYPNIGHPSPTSQILWVIDSNKVLQKIFSSFLWITVKGRIVKVVKNDAYFGNHISFNSYMWVIIVWITWWHCTCMKMYTPKHHLWIHLQNESLFAYRPIVAPKLWYQITSYSLFTLRVFARIKDFFFFTKSYQS